MRYLPLTHENRQEMLKTIGVADVASLFAEVPASARLSGPVAGLPAHQSEMDVERHMAALAARNKLPEASFHGGGAYRHHIPASVDMLIQRGEFLTSYTPYQPEVSQGTLQMLFEFQSQVCALTGMEVANASMYDGATATAEAVAMAGRVTGRKQAVLHAGLHPHYREVVQTSAKWTGLEIAESLTDKTACVVVQTPDFFGEVHDFTKLAEECHAAGALLVVVVTEIVSLGLLKAPGNMGADIVVGEGQSLGNPLSFGGPYVGLFATREKFVRQMPGRLCGETVDAEGRKGFVLTLSTREQHIRREKATSNICTNSGLCALAFSIHLSLLGEAGLKHLAALNHAKACQLADMLGDKVQNQTFFNEFVVKTAKPAAEYAAFGIPLSRFFPSRPHELLVAVTELTTDEEMAKLVEALG